MLVWMAVNQELADGASLQRSTTVCWPSGEWSSRSLEKQASWSKPAKLAKSAIKCCYKVTQPQVLVLFVALSQ